jgi:prevent-host-death family protein
MKSVRMHEAKTHLSSLIREVEAGEEIVVHRGSEPVAMIVPYRPPAKHRRVGALKGQIWMAPDFDETPEDFREYME